MDGATRVDCYPPSATGSLASARAGPQIALPPRMLTQSQIKAAHRRARGNVQSLLDHRNAFTIGWCAAFVQWGKIHVIQRAHLAEVRS